MVISKKYDAIITEIIQEQCNYAEIFDAETFKMPAECYTSIENYEYDKEMDLEHLESAGLIAEDREISIDPYYECSFASTLDISDMTPGEIEIEDEIKMGYLWQKYKK